MTSCRLGFPLATGIWLAICPILLAGSVVGLARTDGQPLETGPFDSQPTASGPQITYEFQSMYLVPQPNTWTKQFRWTIAANTGLVPGDTLTIEESIRLIYPDNVSGGNSVTPLTISDWHETISSSDLSNFLQWNSHDAGTHIRAHIGDDELSIDPRASFSSDGNSIWFDFDPIQIPTQIGTSSIPVTLDILKQVRWIGPVLDPLPTVHYIDIPVNEYPSTSPIGDYNGNDVVDAADYVAWRKSLGTTYTQSDYDLWRAHFGQTASGAGNGFGAVEVSVPEANALVLASCAAAPAFLFRKNSEKRRIVTLDRLCS